MCEKENKHSNYNRALQRSHCLGLIITPPPPCLTTKTLKSRVFFCLWHWVENVSLALVRRKHNISVIFKDIIFIIIFITLLIIFISTYKYTVSRWSSTNSSVLLQHLLLLFDRRWAVPLHPNIRFPWHASKRSSQASLTSSPFRKGPSQNVQPFSALIGRIRCQSIPFPDNVSSSATPGLWERAESGWRGEDQHKEKLAAIKCTDEKERFVGLPLRCFRFLRALRGWGFHRSVNLMQWRASVCPLPPLFFRDGYWS